MISLIFTPSFFAFAARNAVRGGDFIDQPRFVLRQLEAARGVAEDRFTGRLLRAVCWSEERHFDSSEPAYLRIPALAYFLPFVRVYVGIPARPYEGWSVNIAPVRSTVVALPRIWMEDHALDPPTTAGVWDDDGVAETGFFVDGSAVPFAVALRTRNVGVIRCASGDFKYS